MRQLRVLQVAPGACPVGIVPEQGSKGGLLVKELQPRGDTGIYICPACGLEPGLGQDPPELIIVRPCVRSVVGRSEFLLSLCQGVTEGLLCCTEGCRTDADVLNGMAHLMHCDDLPVCCSVSIPLQPQQAGFCYGCIGLTWYGSDAVDLRVGSAIRGVDIAQVEEGGQIRQLLLPADDAKCRIGLSHVGQDGLRGRLKHALEDPVQAGRLMSTSTGTLKECIVL